jgi:hypothetical protein
MGILMTVRFFRLGLVLLLVAAIAVAAGTMMPWKNWVEAGLERALESQGFKNVRLTVSDIGLDSVVLKDFSFGEPPLVFKDVTLEYALRDLLSGKVESLSVGGLALQMRKSEQGWGVVGLDGTSEEGWIIPVTREELEAIPLDAAALRESTLRIDGGEWEAEIPLQAAVQKRPSPTISYEAEGVRFKRQNASVVLAQLSAEAALNERDGQWDGTWRVQGVQIEGIGTPVPTLSGGGILKAFSELIELGGELKSEDQAVKVVFRTEHFLKARELSKLTIIQAKMPWSGGVLTLRNVEVPYQGEADIPVSLEVQSVSADALLQQLTGKKATATGVISGMLPMVLKRNGSFEVREGALATEEPGVIQMSPEAIPGDHQQVALVRDILADFHYTKLSILIESGGEKGVSVRLGLEGANPRVQQGRAVKLSVNLTGDVLGFVQQNLLWLTNPKKFLEQGNDAKN